MAIAQHYSLVMPLFICAMLHVAEVAAADKSEQPTSSVAVKLTISVEEYSPSKPSKGVVKCAILNKAHVPAEVQVGYDGRTNVLAAHGNGHRWEVMLYRHQKPPVELKHETVKPGKDQIIFELALDEILLQGQESEPKAKDRIWGWDWSARPEGPRSPIHQWRKSGYLDKATFRADIMVNGKSVSSDEVVLKVKSDDAGKQRHE